MFKFNSEFAITITVMQKKTKITSFLVYFAYRLIVVLRLKSIDAFG